MASGSSDFELKTVVTTIPTTAETRSNLLSTPTTEPATNFSTPYSSEELQTAIEDLLMKKIGAESFDQVRQSLKAPGSDSSEWIRIPRKCFNIGVLFASFGGHFEMLTWLLEQGGRATYSDSKGRTAIHYAICSANRQRQRSAQCLNVLIEKGAEIDVLDFDRKMTPLLCAVTIARDDLVQILLKANAEVDGCKFENGPWISAVHLAAQLGRVKCLEKLIDHDEKNVQLTNDYGQHPIHVAAVADQVESVELLVKKDSKEINVQDKSGQTPLHLAVKCQSTRSVSELIKKGCDINARDNFGFTPLHLAAMFKYSDMALLLIESGGAKLMIKDNRGISALAMVALRAPSVIQRRLDSGLLPVMFKEQDKLRERDLDLELQLDFRVLMAGKDKGVGELDVLDLLSRTDQRHLLQHPIILAFLHLKWSKIRYPMYASLLFHIAFVSLLTYAIFSIYAPCWAENSTAEESSSSTSTTTNIVLWPAGALVAGAEVFFSRSSWKDYLKDQFNWLQFSSIVGMVIVTIPFNGTYNEWQRLLAAGVIILASLYLMMEFGRFPTFGLHVHMFTKVAKSIFKLFLPFTALIMGFSSCFIVLFPDVKSLATMPGAVLTTLIMMTGEYGYTDIFYKKDDQPFDFYRVTTFLVFFIFILFIVIILANLLIGLAVSDIHGLQESAELNRLIRQIRANAQMEKFIFSFVWNRLLCSSRCVTKIQNWFLVVDLSDNSSSFHPFTFKPNDPGSKQFPRKITDSLLNKINQT